MKNYLSFGGGVNSVAMMLLLLDEGVEFEAVYVDHGCDWPETYEYIKMLGKKYAITIIKPEVNEKGIIYNNLFEYSWKWKMMPNRTLRWCTDKFKVRPLQRYFDKPAFILLGIDNNETHRARLGSAGFENRYPLIEREINREMCRSIIKAHNLPVPIKSGCFFCPFQKIGQFRVLRRKHPDLFCKAVELEKRNNTVPGRKPYYIFNHSLPSIIDDHAFLFDDMTYPPCQCGL